jgi:phage gp29-like protein
VLTLQAVKTEPVEQLRGVAVLKAGVNGDDQTAIEQALDALSAGELNTDMVSVLKPLMVLAEQDPDGLGAKLGTIWPQMDDEALTERIAQVMFVAELWGQVNAEAI